jgi:hypothetical protein
MGAMRTCFMGLLPPFDVIKLCLPDESADEASRQVLLGPE